MPCFLPSFFLARKKKEPAVDRQRTGSLWGGLSYGHVFVSQSHGVPLPIKKRENHRSGVWMMRVTGPSLVLCTFMAAPKTPV
jgi:hypothetical protein